jgi:glycosyltransferase involved in cell wall biosynthesis
LINGRKIVVVMPAYNAEHTLRKTYGEIPKEFMDSALLVDDSSTDSTLRVAEELGIKTIVHERNKGYGANQKTCYTAALNDGADIIVMLHPDYQYNPRLIPAIVTLLAYGPYDVVLASRILGQPRGNMPRYRYIGNRLLTGFENALWRTKLSEFHTGLRGFKRYVLEGVNFLANSDDFVFDNQILAQILLQRYSIGEISCPALYFPESSSINFRKSLKYGLGVTKTALDLVLASNRIWTPNYLMDRGRSKSIRRDP